MTKTIIIEVDSEDSEIAIRSIVSDFPDARLIDVSARVKSGLERARERGVKLGGDRGNLSEDSKTGRIASQIVRQENARKFSQTVCPYITEAKRSGVISLQGLADYLNNSGILTRNACRWTPTAVKRVMDMASLLDKNKN